jgi:hypothetical protein
MDGSTIQVVGLIALAVAMVMTLFEMRMSLQPDACPECPHCQARQEAERRVQEDLARQYARRHGLDRDDEDDRKIG